MGTCAITAGEQVCSLGVDAEACHRGWIASARPRGSDYDLPWDLPVPPQPWQDSPDRSLALATSVLSRMSVALSEASRRWGPAKLGVMVGVRGGGDPSKPDDLVELTRRHARARGPAYSVTGDIAAGAGAVRSALELLDSGACDGVVVLAASGAVTPRSAFWEARGELGAPTSWPLMSDRNGLRPAEGAAAVLLERQGRADVELRGGASTNDAAEAIRVALARAHRTPRQVTWVLCGADGRVEADLRLAHAIRDELGTTVPVTSAVSHRGSLGAAQDVAGIVDVLRSVEAGRVGPMYRNAGSDALLGSSLVAESNAIETDTALTLHAGIDGSYSAFVLGAREP